MTVAFLFPGQGAQSEGLLHRLPQHAEVTRTIAEASEVLGLDIARPRQFPGTTLDRRGPARAAGRRGRDGARTDGRTGPPRCRRRHVGRRLWRSGRLRHIVLRRCLAARPPAWRADAGGLPERLRPGCHRRPRRGPGGRPRGADPDPGVVPSTFPTSMRPCRSSSPAAMRRWPR